MPFSASVSAISGNGAIVIHTSFGASWIEPHAVERLVDRLDADVDAEGVLDGLTDRLEIADAHHRTGACVGAGVVVEHTVTNEPGTDDHRHGRDDGDGSACRHESYIPFETLRLWPDIRHHDTAVR